MPAPVGGTESYPKAPAPAPTLPGAKPTGDGYSLGNEQITRRPGVAVTTIRSHLSSVDERLRLGSRVELALFAAQAGAATF